MKTVTDEAVELLTKKELVERKLSEVDHLKREEQSWSDNHYVTMNSIITDGYKPNDNYPIISKDNIVMDGNHRLAVLQELHGDDYVVKFKLVNYKYNRLIFIGGLVKLWVRIKRVFRRKNK
jgi:hypothetical protein